MILREFIKAHHARGDLNVEQRYIPRLNQMVEEMESGRFQDVPKEEQKMRLNALMNEYLGRGEVFWLLSPKHLEPEYQHALERAFKEYLDNLQQ